MKKTTIALVALFAAALAWFLIVERRTKPREDAERDARRLFQWEESDVRALRIVRPDATIRLERAQDQKWRMTEPIETRADRWAAESAAGALAEMEALRTLADDRGPFELQELGLDAPRARVELTLSPSGGGGETLATIVEFGAEAPATRGAFARIPGRDAVYLVPASAVQPFLKPPADYRDRSLVDATILDVGEARVSRREGDLRFKRRGEVWWVEEPFEDRADGSAVQAAISAVIGLRAESFLDLPAAGTAAPVRDSAVREDSQRVQPESTNSSPKGLDPPAATVRLLTRGGEELATVRLGAPAPDAPDSRVVSVGAAPGPSTAAIVSSAGLASLSKPASEFRARSALSFRPWDATGLDLHAAAVTLSFVKKEGVWTASTPSSLLIDPDAVEETLRLLSDLEVATFDAGGAAPVAALGLDPPRTRFEIRLGPPDEGTLTLVLGSPAGESGTVYARTLDRPVVFTVSSSILDRIRSGADLYAASEAADAPITPPAGSKAAEEP